MELPGYKDDFLSVEGEDWRARTGVHLPCTPCWRLAAREIC